MKRNALKILSVILVAIMLVASVSTIVLAGGEGEGTTAASLSPGEIYRTASDTTDTTSVLSEMIGNVITVVQVIGIGVAIVMLIVLAIKYISAAPGDKADIKKHAVVYVVGAVVLFAASGILQIVKNFAGNVKA